MDDREKVTHWGRWMIELAKARGINTPADLAERLGTAVDEVQYLTRLVYPASNLRSPFGLALCRVLQTDFKVLLGRYRFLSPSDVPIVTDAQRRAAEAGEDDDEILDEKAVEAVEQKAGALRPTSVRPHEAAESASTSGATESARMRIEEHRADRA